MGYNTKIDWCDASWNPVTGCLHDCEYCYARGIAHRFGGFSCSENGEWDSYRARYLRDFKNSAFELDKPLTIKRDGERRKAPYPFEFAPTFHRYRLKQPAEWTQPRTIFVCSMSDLFGAWVPDEWIQDVFSACNAASWHRYLFLTKNPARYIDLAKKGMLPEKHWYGYSATTDDMLWKFHHADECPVKNLFVSIEPIHGDFSTPFSTHCPADWVIVGAETGKRKDIIRPKREWVDGLLRQCEYSGRPIFMKESLKELMGSSFKQEFPWECKQ